jgi:hypothetical protein
VTELRALPDRAAAQSASVFLDDSDDPAHAQAALSAAFDDPAVTDVTVFAIGDGAAMSGLRVAGRRQDENAISLIFLLD